jgi:hypothetical protein
VKLGVFSLWKGQQAFHSRPARTSFTDGEMIADSSVRARSSSRKAGLKLIGRTDFLAFDSAGRKRRRSIYPQMTWLNSMGENLTHPARDGFEGIISPPK